MFTKPQIYKIFARVFCHLLLLSLVFNPVVALSQTLPIVADGATNTQVTKTASGIDQVNIAAPDSSGLSRNTFTHYNINQSGQVINNFSGNVASEVVTGSGAAAITSTQIGGLVTANQNLHNSGSARIILNEVTSSNNTQLLGYAEIAGTKAELIIANSNGITCAGCGFINTSRLSFIAGASETDSGGNLNFNLKEQTNLNLTIPLITISGLGLDAETTTSTDIIASSIKLISTIYGGENTDVTLKTGEGKYNAVTKEIAPNSAAITPNTELFAVDASNLGSIQAGRIFIIATKNGFGVNLDSNLIAGKELNLDAAGNLYYSNLSAPSITAKATGNITHKESGAAIATNNLNIEAGETFTSSASATDRTTNGSATIKAKNLVNSGNILTTDTLTLTLAESLTNRGVINADIINIRATNDIKNQSGIIGTLTITDPTNSSIAQAFTASQINLTANNLINSGQIYGTNLVINLSNLLANQSLIRADNQITANVASLNNSDEISAQNISFTNSASFINSNNFYALNNLNLSVASLENSGVIYADNNFVLTAIDFSNLGYLSTSSALTILGISTANNSGTISASADLNLTANSFTNSASGVIYSARNSNIFSTQNIANEGVIAAANNLNFNANILTNSYLLQSGSDLAIAATALTNSGEITSKASQTLALKNLSNSGTIYSEDAIILNADTLNNSAIIYSQDNATLTVSGDFSNQAAAQIYSDKILTISAKNLVNLNTMYANQISITSTADVVNSGIIESATTLNLNAMGSAMITNSGILTSKDRLTLTSNSGNITNSGSLYSQGGNFTFTSSANLENYGNITANTNLTIASNLASFINKSSGNIASNDYALVINDTSNSFQNFGNILSNSSLNLTTNILTNNSLIQSNGALTLNSTTLNNNSSTSLILATSDLAINSKNTNNQNTKSSGDIASSGIISGNGGVTINSDILNNDSGLIRGRSVNTNAYTLGGDATISNVSGRFTAIAAAVILNLGATADYTITGDITAADYIDITANSILNLGNVTTTDYIKLNATSGSITNGTQTGDNSNIKLAAGTYLSATASDKIINWATLSAETDLTLTAAGEINNYGSITGGEGSTIITSTSNNFNNAFSSSKLTAAGDLTFNLAQDLNNYGAIAAKNDLMANANNSIYNYNTALIWSGNDATFNTTNNFLNQSADIYAENNLTIQKNNSSDATNNKVNILRNISGNIETYNGNIIIKAATLENKRLIAPISTPIDATSGPIFIDVAAGTTPSNYNLYNWVLNNNGCFATNCGQQYFGYYAKAPTNSNSVTSNISSGGSLQFAVNNLTNQTSQITSASDMSINSDVIDNLSIYDSGLYSIISKGATHYEFYQLNYQNRHIQYEGGNSDSGDRLNYLDYAQAFTSQIKSGGSLTGRIASQINNTTISQNTTVTSATQQSYSTTYNNIDLQQLANSGVINLDLSTIINAINQSSATPSSVEISDSVLVNSVSAPVSTSENNASINLGSLTINKSTNSNKPLIEARSIFTNKDEFFGSSYFFTAMGIDGDSFINNINGINAKQNRMLGDAFAENKLIAAQLTQLRKDSLFLDDGVTSSSTQIKSLIDNAVAELSRLNLTAFDVATRGLSSSQANSLTNDIITFEATNINGMSIIVPKIYLSLSTRNKLLGTSDSVTSDSASASLATGSTIYSGGDLTINSPSASLTNNGSIISNGNLTLNLASLTSTSSITTLPTIAAPTIKSVAGSINIATTNNITLKNTLLNSGNKITLSAKDINISNDNPIFVTSSSSYSSSTPLLFATSSIKDDAEAARSAITFNAASDIELNSSGSINIANNYLNTSGSIFMTAASDINNSNYTIKAAENVVMSAGNNINNISTAKTAAEAEATPTKIEAGSIVSLDAGNNINNIGATIKGGDLVYLTAANNVNNLALVNYSINGQTTNQDQTITTGSAKRGNLTTTTISGYSTDSETGLTSNAITQTQALESNANNIKSTLVSQGSITAGESSTGTSGNVVIVAGHNLNNKASNITATGDTYLEATAGDINIETAALRDRVVTSWGNKRKGGTKTEDIITNTESNITSNGNLDMVSGNNITLQAAKVKAADDINITASHNLLLTTATDSFFVQIETKKKSTFSFKNGTSLDTNTAVLNNEIASTNSGEINLNSGNFTYLEYKTGAFEQALKDKEINQVDSSNSLNYLTTLTKSETALHNPIDEIHKHWDQTSRGLTGAGTALVVVAAVAATVLTAGAAAPAMSAAVTTAAAVGTASASTLAATASTSATNASMNDNGNFFRSLDDVSKTTLRESTSSDTLRSMTISGLTAGAASGISQYYGIAQMSQAANAVNTVDGTRTAAQVMQNVQVSLLESAVSNGTSSIIQSAVNHESVSDTLQHLTTNIAVGAIANIAAKEIGNAAHPTDQYGNSLTPKIDQSTQLALHATLGCAVGAVQGGNCGAGAAAGVVGEIAGEALKDSIQNGDISRSMAIQLAGLSGSAASLLASAATGQSDEKTANSIFAGQRIGSNAAENNALQIKAQRVAGTKNHLTIVHTPEPDEQAAYANRDGYVQDKESGLWIRTWGAGGSDLIAGDLVSKSNRPRDADLSIKNYISPNLVPSSQEFSYVQLLNDLDKNYQDNLKYNLFPNPSSSSGYNSNSYVSGLLISADIVPPSIPDKQFKYQWQSWEYDNSPSTNINYTLPFQVPGYDKPIPSQYFKPNQ